MASNLVKSLPPLPKKGDKDLLALLEAIKRLLEVREGVGHHNQSDMNVTFRDLYQYHTGSTFGASFAEGPRGYATVVPKPPTDLVVVAVGATSRRFTWTWPLDSKPLDGVEVWASSTSSRSLAERIALVTWPVAEYTKGGFPSEVTMYFWIRIIRGGSYSSWEPPDNQGGYVVTPEEIPTINELLDELTQMDRYTTSFTMILDAFQIMQPSGAVPVWQAGIYNKYDKVKHTLPGPGYSYYQSLADNNSDEPPSDNWLLIDPAVDTPLRTFTIGNVDGIPTVGIHGDLLIDHSLRTRHLAADEIFTASIASSNYVEGVDGWKIDAATGVAEFNNYQMVINYGGVSGTPTSLLDINATEFAKLNTGIESWVTGNFVDAVTYAADIADLQAQIDGQVEIWFGDVVPGPTVAPESSWLSPDTRSQHLGDLYYDRVGGLAYRYAMDGASYVWDVTNDSTAQALALAQDAYDLADGKRRVFLVEPVPPYDAGDLWRKTAHEIWACTTGRETGSYTASDWVLASTVGAPVGTTVGGIAVTTLVTRSLLDQAELLFADSFDAYGAVPDLSSRWTVNQATSQLSRVTGLAGVGYALRSLDDVGGLGISIDKTITATPSVIFTARFIYQTIGGTTSAFYNGLPMLYGDLGTTFTLSVTGGMLKYRDSLGVDINIVACPVNVVHDLLVQCNCLAGEATVVLDGVAYGPYPLMVASTVINLVRIRSYISNQEDYTLDDVAIYAGDVSLADLVTTAQSTADSAVAAAAAANDALTDIANDDLLTPVEKPPIVQQVTILVNEQAAIDAQATAFGITTEKTAYDNALAALVAYLATLTTPVLWSTSGNTTIVRTTFTAAFTTVYSARQALLNAIYAAAKVLADAAQTTGDTAQATADGKNTVFVQVEVPTANKVNDQWVDLGSNNRVLHSDSLDNAYWDLGQATIVPDAAANYAGEMTADKLQENLVDGYHFVADTTFQYTAGKFYLHSVDVKAAGRDYARLALVAGAFGTIRRVDWNLTTGVAGAVTGTPEFYDSIDLGNGWWRLFIGQTATITAATHGGLVYACITSGDASYPGDGASGIYIARQTVAELDSAADAAEHALAQYIPTTDTAIDHTGYNRLHRWTGTTWEAIQDTAILQAQLAADTAQAAADAAQQSADDAQLAADQAQLDADTANAVLAEIANDSLLTPVEKPPVIQRRDVLVAEQTGIDAQAVAYGITTEKTAYDDAIASLVAYLATLISPVLWSDTSGNTIIVRDDFLAAFSLVDTTRQTLLNKIYEEAKALADAAQVSANAAALTAVWANVTGDGRPEDNATVGAPAGTNVGGTPAENVEANAAAAIAAANNMSADGWLSAQEKALWRVQWPGMEANYAAVIAQATAYGLTADPVITTLQTSQSTLYTYLATTLQVWSAPTVATAISPDTQLRDYVDDYYAKLGAAVNTITDHATAVALNADPEDISAWASDPAARVNANSTTISGQKITSGTILANQIGTSQLFAYHVGANEIIANTANIKNAIITGAKIASATITNANMANASIDTANIVDANVTTLKIAGNAVIVPVGAYASSALSITSTYPTWQTVLSVSVTTGYVDLPVVVSISIDATTILSGSLIVGLFRGTTLLASTHCTVPGSVTFQVIDENPSASATTYYAKCTRGLSGGTVAIENRSLTVMGLKR
ncbi:MAG: phage head spike fiber domain-containing protein [Thermodesulfobacteriota bacterium]